MCVGFPSKILELFFFNRSKFIWNPFKKKQKGFPDTNFLKNILRNSPRLAVFTVCKLSQIWGVGNHHRIGKNLDNKDRLKIFRVAGNVNVSAYHFLLRWRFLLSLRPFCLFRLLFDVL